MARIPYPDDSNPEVAQLRAQIVAERGKLLNLYRMLLNSPPVAQGWLNFLTAIRQKCLISGRLRELAILRIAVINQADYEFVSHVPFALKEGLTQQQIDAVSNWEASSLYSDQERAVLGYTDSMTRDVHVPEAALRQLATRQRLGEGAPAGIARADKQQAQAQASPTRSGTLSRRMTAGIAPGRMTRSRRPVQSTTVDGGDGSRRPPSSTRRSPRATALPHDRVISLAEVAGCTPGRFALVDVMASP